MEENAAPTPLQRAIGILVLGMAAVVTVTPLALAVAVRSSDASTRSVLLIVAALIWLLALVTYRGLALAHEHWRRRTLRKEIATARRARLDAYATFQDKLNDQHAILDRIAEITEAILEEGIIDPQLAIDSVRLASSHAREAQALVEDTIIEIRVETGAADVDVETFDTRDEIEDVARLFVRSGVKVVTRGPRQFVDSDPSLFRLMVRGLVASAVEREAEDIDVSVARDGNAIVCTVSDNGHNKSHDGVASVSAVTKSLALTVDATLGYSRVLGRNQYSVAIPAAETPEYATITATPMDVLGQRHTSQAAPQPPADPLPRGGRSEEEMITFLHDQERDLERTVAARRERDLASR